MQPEFTPVNEPGPHRLTKRTDAPTRSTGPALVPTSFAFFYVILLFAFSFLISLSILDSRFSFPRPRQPETMHTSAYLVICFRISTLNSPSHAPVCQKPCILAPSVIARSPGAPGRQSCPSLGAMPTQPFRGHALSHGLHTPDPTLSLRGAKRRGNPTLTPAFHAGFTTEQAQ